MIENRRSLIETSAHELALDCVHDGIAAANPTRATCDIVSVDGEWLTIGAQTYDLRQYEEILVVGGGKAAGGVVVALESILGERIDGGQIVTTEPVDTEHVTAAVGDHPTPSERNVNATSELLAPVKQADAETLVLAVVTGGGSALLAAPAPGLEITDLQTMTERLLDAGVGIHDVNTVRKHLSTIKGGGLAATAAPATVVGLLVSDVVGDDYGTIASGPTVPTSTTPTDAQAVLDRNDVTPTAAVASVLDEASRSGDTARPGTDWFERTTNILVCDSTVALDAAAERARTAGFEPLLLTARARGEARELGRQLVAIAEEIAASGNPVEPPAVLLAGGESTVTVAGDGRGGPNQELALSAACELTAADCVVAAVDSDGADGSTEFAGAIVDGETVDDGERARSALEDNNVTPFLDSVDATIETGPTGTNVNDLSVVVVPDTAE